MLLALTIAAAAAGGCGSMKEDVPAQGKAQDGDAVSRKTIIKLAYFLDNHIL